MTAPAWLFEEAQPARTPARTPVRTPVREAPSRAATAAQGPRPLWETRGRGPADATCASCTFRRWDRNNYANARCASHPHGTYDQPPTPMRSHADPACVEYRGWVPTPDVRRTP